MGEYDRKRELQFLFIFHDLLPFIVILNNKFIKKFPYKCKAQICNTVEMNIYNIVRQQ